MTRPAPEHPLTPLMQAPHPLEHLTPQERAVYQVLADNSGRVLSRHELARRAGLGDLSPRRCDSIIVGIRRAIGAEQVQTVRRRGWMLLTQA